MHPSWNDLARWVDVIQQDTDHVFWNRLTGRSIRFHQETVAHPLSDPIKLRLQREWMWSKDPT